MKGHMEIVWVDLETGESRMTGIAPLPGDGDARAFFEACRHLDVSAYVRFLLDLYDEAGDLVDTISLSRAGFRAVTGMEPASREEYRDYEMAYVQEAMRRDSMPATETDVAASGGA